MVYITNWDLVSKYLYQIQDFDSLISLVDQSLSLLKQYGRNLKTSKNLEIIRNIDQSLADFIVLLDNVGKLNKKDLTKIKFILKNSGKDYKKQFNLVSGPKDVSSEVTASLKQKFGDADVSSQQSNQIGISLTWEGYYFKRNLDSDLDKLLK